MSSFYKEIILNDARVASNSRINDMGLLEPVTRLAVQNIIAEAKQLGLELIVFETYRSKQRQEELYYAGKSKLKDVGVHHYGLACDIVKNANGKPSWDGSFALLGKLAYKYGLIWGGDWGNSSVHHDFIDSVHVQRCSIKRQNDLFADVWFPSSDYNPYKDINLVMESLIPENALSMPQVVNPNLTINLLEHVNYDDNRLETLQSVLQLMEKVLNSEEFKNKILEFTTNGQKCFFYRRSLFGRYIDQPCTNEQVYNMILTADEQTDNIQSNTIDLYLELVNGADGSVIGYGNSESKEIYTYSVMFDQMSKEDLANHYTHEWCHKLGFEHSFQRTSNRNHSVPYAVGNIVEDLAHQITPTMSTFNT